MKKLSLSQSTLAFAFAIGVNFLLQIVFSLVLSLQIVDRDLTQYIFMICLQACNLFIVVYMTKNKAQEPNFAVLSPRISNLWKVGLLTIFTLIGCYICTLFVTEVVEKTGAQAGQINIDGGYLVLAIISTCVFAPIGEEGIYRYLLLSGLKEKFSPTISIILSALAFALMHMSPYQLFYQFFLGLALGVVAVKTGNIVLCIIMHALSNLLVILLAFFPQIEVFFLSSPYFIIVGVVALFCFALAFLFVAKFLKMEHTVELKRDKNAQNKGDEIGLLVYIITIVVCLSLCVFAIFG